MSDVFLATALAGYGVTLATVAKLKAKGLISARDMTEIYDEALLGLEGTQGLAADPQVGGVVTIARQLLETAAARTRQGLGNDE